MNVLLLLFQNENEVGNIIQLIKKEKPKVAEEISTVQDNDEYPKMLSLPCFGFSWMGLDCTYSFNKVFKLAMDLQLQLFVLLLLIV